MGGRADGRADATAMVVMQLATAARRLWQFMAKYRKSTKYEGLCVTIFYLSRIVVCGTTVKTGGLLGRSGVERRSRRGSSLRVRPES